MRADPLNRISVSFVKTRACDPPDAEIEPILAEASSEARRPPSYEELWLTRPIKRSPAKSARAKALGDGVAFWIGAAALVIGAMALIGLREKIVKIAPAMARAYTAIGLPVNIDGFELKDVRSRIVMDGARKVLTVEGEIVNLRREANAPPLLALTVRGADGRAKYAWTSPAPKARLAAGETIAFRARLAAPPESGVDVLVHFASAEDRAGK